MDVPDEPSIPPFFSAAAIKQVREANSASQSVFAGCLNVSTSTIRRWEAGAVKPNGVARKLLFVVQKHGLQILA